MNLALRVKPEAKNPVTVNDIIEIMKITEKQKLKLQTFLNKKKVGKCSCGNDHFTFVDRMYELREFSGGGLVLGGDNSILPVVIFVCDECGEIKMLSAVLLGVVDNQEKDVKSDDRQ